MRATGSAATHSKQAEKVEKKRKIDKNVLFHHHHDKKPLNDHREQQYYKFSRELLVHKRKPPSCHSLPIGAKVASPSTPPTTPDVSPSPEAQTQKWPRFVVAPVVSAVACQRTSGAHGTRCGEEAEMVAAAVAVVVVGLNW